MNKRNGQSLIEIIIGLGVAVSLIGAAILATVFILRSNTSNQKYQIAAGLNNELVDKIRTVAGANWNALYLLPNKGPSGQYYIDVFNGKLSFFVGVATTSIENEIYASFFSVENVNRDASENIVESGWFQDPSTQKVTVYTRWGSSASQGEVKTVDYLTRWANAAFRQVDWSGGAANGAPLAEPDNKFASSTGIDFSTPGSIKIQGF